MEGTVKFFNRSKGFGFINGDDGKDYFVHVSALPQGVFLRDNDRVSFNPSEGDRGLKAQDVQLLEKGSDRGGFSAQKPARGNEEEPAEENLEGEGTVEEEPAEE